jgi:branched-chain amino acid transport system ATP-binding protein
MTGEPLLEVDRLSAWYGRAQILFDVTLEVRRGEVVAFMGRNGAGKSTTLKAIMGLVERTRGQTRFHGQALRDLQAFEIARLGLGYVPEDRRIFSDLTVMEIRVGRRRPRERPCVVARQTVPCSQFGGDAAASWGA